MKLTNNRHSRCNLIKNKNDDGRYDRVDVGLGLRSALEYFNKYFI